MENGLKCRHYNWKSGASSGRSFRSFKDTDSTVTLYAAWITQDPQQSVCCRILVY